MKLRDLGERKIIENMKNLYGTIVDDDAFYFNSGNRFILITTDVITKRTHIPDGADPKHAGYFFAALNLSDIAAMGGSPKYFMSAYSMNGNIDYTFFENFNKGIKECLSKYDTKMVGGDTKEGEDFTATGIAIGYVSKNKIMLRKNFKKGQAVGVTNFLGKNGAGFYLWKNGNEYGIKKLLEIEPRIKEGILLSRFGVRAAMDLSDGIFSSIEQIKKLTGTGFKIYFENIPADKLAIEVSEEFKIPLEEITLNFGGEYELLFSVDKDHWEYLKKKMDEHGILINYIGETWEGNNVLVKNGKEVNIKEYGYEHFKRGNVL